MRLKLATLSLCQLVLAAASSPFLRPRDYGNKDYYALELSPGADPGKLAEQIGLEYEGPVGELAHHYLFSGRKCDSDVVSSFRRRRLGKRDSDPILFSEKQRVKTLHKRSPIKPRQGPALVSPSKAGSREAQQARQKIADSLEIRDPIFNTQWHLFNPVDRAHDINVTGLWLEGITGKNSTVAIVDDGLDMYSEDLKDNYFARGSYDFNDHVSEPKPRLGDDTHGTRCAGEIAAVKNDVCGVGVAWDSKVAGIRILSKQISDADEAIALNYAYQDNLIYSCSWGPPDDGRSMEAPGILIKKAMMKGIQEGRNGKGSVFVFASGNGAANDDNCNFDGYTNSIYSITVGAIDRKGLHPYYSELCSAQMVVTYSSGSGDSIHTTDVGSNKCYDGHGGTSAAAPLAAGIFALVLQVRPELTWRDLQYLAWDTAVPVNEDDPDWMPTAGGKKFNHKYGFGKLDAWSIVHAAKDFKSVKPQAWYKSPILAVNHPIPEGNVGLKSEIEVTKKQLEEANLERVEHIQVHMNAKHGKRGDMSVDLVSPTGVVSHIATTRKLDDNKEGYKDWNFMSVKHWGEDGVGKWTIMIKDTEKNQFNGTLVDWGITLWGIAKDPEKATLHPLPGDSKSLAVHPLPLPTTAAGSATTTHLPSISTTAATVTKNPTDHPDRPVNSKHPGTTSTPASSSPVSSSPASSSVNATSVPATETNAPEGASPGNGGFFSFLPTFGVSPSTQAWIYGSAVAIVGFISAVAIYLARQRKKARARKDGMNYEFEALNDEDDDGQGGNRGAATGGRRKARDLYDAFGASDDEELFSDSDEDAAEKGYYDEEAHGVDEGERVGDREKLLSRDDRP